MFLKFFQSRKNIILATLLLAFFAFPKDVFAENLFSVGSGASVLTATSSAIFANISNTSPASTFMLMLQKAGNELFKVDTLGNVTLQGTLTMPNSPLTTSISAANITSGEFGSVIGAGGNYVFGSTVSGNVGIGITPTVKLHVQGNGTTAAAFMNGNVGIGLTNPIAKLSISGSLNADEPRLSFVASDNSQRFTIETDLDSTTSNDLLGIRSSSVDDMLVLKGNGNVGIGTANPTSLFHVESPTSATTLKVVGGGVSGTRYTGPYLNLVRKGIYDQFGINYYTESTLNWFTGIPYTGGTASANRFIIGPSSSIGTDTVLLLRNGGFVGINNANPQAALDVVGQIKMTNSNITTSTDVINKGYLDSIVTPSSSPTAGTQFGFWTAGAANSIYSNNSGNVGIGTINPVSKLALSSATSTFLTISNTVNSQGVVGGILFSSQSETSYRKGAISFVRSEGNANRGYLSFALDGNANNANVDADIIGNTKMVINYLGNVGIGTTTPGSLLTLGNAFALTSGGTMYSGTLNTRYLDLSGVMANGISVPNDIYSSAGSLKIAGAGNNYLMGKTGIGTTSPLYSLDVTGDANISSTLNIAGNRVLTLPSNNPEVGPWNPIWTAIGASKPLYFDEEFAIGNNNVGVYNGQGNGSVTITRLVGESGVPNSTGNMLKVSYDGILPSSPGFGGVIQAISSVANRTYVQRFRAKLPVGRNFVLAENSQGTNSTSYWLTNTAGTGKWEDYVRVSHAGNTGAFSSSGHIYVTGGSGAFDWYISSMNIYEVNTPIIASPNTWNSAQTFRAGAIFPGSGVWNSDGNVGVGTVTPKAQLDLYSNVGANIVSGNLLLSRYWASVSNTRGSSLFHYSDGANDKIAFGVAGDGGSQATPNQISQAKMVIQANGNVGIGSTTPTAKLVVSGGNIFVTDAAITSLTPNAVITKAYLDSSLTNSGASFWASSTAGIYNVGLGNVGVGTTAPLHKFVVSDSSLTYTSLGIYNQTNNVNNRNWVIGSNFNSYGDFSIRTSNTKDGNALSPGTDRLTINLAGNVGIGTTTPASVLDVEGLIKMRASNITTSSDVINKGYFDSTLQAVLASTGASLWSSSTAGIYNTDLNGKVGIGLTNPTTPLQFKNNSWISSLNGAGTGVVNMFKVNANNQIEVGAPLNIGSFEFSPDSGLVSFVDMPVSAAPGNGALQGYAFRIDGNNLMTLYSEANGLGGIKNTGLGIGTAAPGAKLDIVGALRTTSATISLLGNSGNRIVMTDDSGNLYATSSSIASGLPAPIAGNKNFTLRSDGANWIANSLIYNNGTNVGIGTTDPGARLDIYSNTNSQLKLAGYEGISGSNVASGQINIGSLGYLRYVGSTGKLYIDNALDSNGGDIRFRTRTLGTPIDAMTISGSGNVGIGTTTPSAALDIKGKLKVTSGGIIYNELSNYRLDLSGILPVSLLTAKGAGIGTTNPLGMVGVLQGMSNYNTAFTAPHLALTAGSAVDNTGFVGITYGASTSANYGWSSGALRSTNGQSDFVWKYHDNNAVGIERLRITKEGFVGIGTSTPSVMLDVAGAAKIGGDLNMSGKDITNVNKLTVATIDPLYRINGVNYSSFAASLVGGVKEEYLGRVKISKRNSAKEYEYRLDFSKIEKGSDLWVWRQTVDFSPENVEVSITPYGAFANTYYFVENNAIILRADKAVDVSYRLSGKRHDWQAWPTRANDQLETPSFIINNGKVIE